MAIGVTIIHIVDKTSFNPEQGEIIEYTDWYGEKWKLNSEYLRLSRLLFKIIYEWEGIRLKTAHPEQKIEFSRGLALKGVDNFGELFTICNPPSDNIYTSFGIPIRYDSEKNLIWMRADNSREDGYPIKDKKCMLKIVGWMYKFWEEFPCYHAWGDTYKVIKEHAGKDARQFIYGVNFYSKELVDKIGREQLLSLGNTGNWQVKEYPRGEISLVLLPNPFLGDPQIKRNAEEFLNLKEKLKDILKPDFGPPRKEPFKLPKDFWK